jgi:hypothetical protein
MLVTDGRSNKEERRKKEREGKIEKKHKNDR